jgi:hypothetical protein
MWLQIGLVLLLVGGGWTLLTRGRIGREREALTLRRVDAYIETIRRERNNRDLMSMTDSELRDLLHSGARNLRAADQKRGWTVLGLAGATLFSAIAVGSNDGWRGVGIVVVVGVIAIYGVNEYLTRRGRAPLEKRGIDIDRLTIE